MNFNGTWVRRGYFDFSADDPRHAPTQAIRKELAAALGRLPEQLRMRSFPVGPAWRHTFWWREGDRDYAEAQFFMQINHYPVLSLGVSVEKGRGDPGATPEETMDRTSWDWQHLIDQCADLLEVDVAKSAADLPQPLNLRVQVLPRGGAAKPTVDDRSFSLIDGSWYERRRGSADIPGIASYLHDVDRQQDCWSLVYFAIDLAPEAIEGVAPTAIARCLLGFEAIRQRLRGIRGHTAV